MFTVASLARVALIVTLLGPPSSTLASPIEAGQRVVLAVRRSFMARTQSRDRSSIAGHGWRIGLGDRLGIGASAGVYPVTSSTGIPVDPHRELVAKVSHAWRRSGRRIRIPAWLLRQEERAQRRALARIAELERHPEYPAEPSWRRGGLPVVPITAYRRGRDGHVLLKWRLRGTSVAELVKAGGGRLAPEVERGFRDIARFQRAVRQLGLGQLDLNHENLLWVDDETLLADLGYRRPGFVLFEFGLLPIGPIARKGLPPDRALKVMLSSGDFPTD